MATPVSTTATGGALLTPRLVSQPSGASMSASATAVAPATVPPPLARLHCSANLGSFGVDAARTIPFGSA